MYILDILNIDADDEDTGFDQLITQKLYFSAPKQMSTHLDSQ